MYVKDLIYLYQAKTDLPDEVSGLLSEQTSSRHPKVTRVSMETETT